MRPGKQLFPLDYSNILNNNNNIKHNIKAIKIIVRETYGGNRTYINQIMFYEENAQQVNDFISGKKKKIIQNFSNKQLKKKFIINKNNSFNYGKNRNKINDQLKNFKDNSSKEDSNSYIYNKKVNKNKKHNIISIKKKKSLTEKEKDNLEDEDIYNEENEILEDLDGYSGNHIKSNGSHTEEEKNIEELDNKNENIEELNFKKINNKNNIKIKKTSKISDKSDIRNKKKNNNKQSLKIKINDNLTPNKYLKRVKSLTNGNNTSISNLNLENLGLVINKNENPQNYSNNIDNNNNKVNILNYSSNKSFKNKVSNNTNYNHYINNMNEDYNINDKYEEGISDMPNNINSLQRNEFTSNSFNKSKILPKNNYKTNFEFDEQLQMLNINDINIRMNKTSENNEFDNNSKTRPSFLSNNQSNNISIFSPKIEFEEKGNELNKDYTQYNENNYINNNNKFSDKKNDKDISNFNINNNTSNNSQRFSIITNHDNFRNNNFNNNSNNSNNRTKLIKEKLDYLEGNILEIKNEINSISENISFLSSKDFIINNFKEQILQICEEIYNEIFNNEKNNNSLISNSNFSRQKKNNKSFLENKINSKIDEKLGNIKNNLFNKFLQPAINEIGNSMKKNLEQIKSEVDTLGNSICKKKILFTKNNSSINDNEESMEFKTSSKLRNEKFEEINRIGEKLYNKLREKEKKLERLKQEKTKFLNDEKKKSNINIEYNDDN